MILIHRPASPGAVPSDALDRMSGSRASRSPRTRSGSISIEPTREEDRLVERHLGIEIPTREEMADIEPSEILYRENNARYMTARILCHSETETPKLIDVSFILTERALVTVRYDEPRAFSMFMTRAVKPGGCRHQPEAVLDGLIETIIDRAAEILANVGPAHRHALAQRCSRATAQGTRRAAGFRAALQVARPQGRHHLERAREHGLGRAAAALPVGLDAAPAARARASRPNGARPCATCSRSRSTPPSCRARCSSCSTRRSASSRSSRTTSSSCSRSWR